MNDLVIGQKLKCYFTDVKGLVSTGWFCGYATICDYSDGSDSVGAYVNAIVKFETAVQVTYELLDLSYVEADNG
jgi:hypothetical protein